MSKSTQYQIQAFTSQFPALFTQQDPTRADRPLLRADKIEEVRVARVTQELLAARPSLRWSEGNLTSVEDDESFFLLGPDLTAIGEVRQAEDGWRAAGDPVVRDGETVGEAIARLGCADEVAAVLHRHTGYEIEDHYSVGGYSVTLYRAPKGWSIPAWVAEQQRRASAQLSAQVAEIDAEGTPMIPTPEADEALARAQGRLG